MPNSSPKISIIVPCYNAEKHLPRCFSSVFAQGFEDWELIAIDDGSSDSTLSWLTAITDPRVRIHAQPNGGVSSARNAGLALARGTYVAFLDSDDTWSSNFLEKMLAAMETEPDVGLAYCGWQNIGLAGPRSVPFIPPDYEQSDKRAKLLASTRWPIHACVTRLDLVLKAGGFNTSFAVGEDFLLWLEIGSFYRVLLVPEVLAQYIHHDGVQATRDRVRAARQLRDVQSDFLARHPEILDELGKPKIRDLTDGMLLRRAYEAYWRRDLDTAQSIFKMALQGGGWRLRDLRYLLLALLPSRLFRWAIAAADRRPGNGEKP